ncbi:hypothetical protein AA0119_g9610 [Alternaria tenuissima]|uniref:BZIP domain-containing protein n=1 Tax=Alternaria tenuissima TaxID=119927 RepID=A0ABY0FZB8_9PLEO|nr:hypothetical protein AA0118_g8719 [Alternaria tenuissima]RYN93318.1 hypothetical protein AA0119_g9610 [Alternaria tenuissima]RYO12552.1 hypothetical protein AA0121_g9089 [Alternaria tenuissima]
MSRQEEDEDWKSLTDANERRRVQNRIAQRNYRRNIKRRLQQLEVFNRSTSDSPPTTPKEKQQSCRTPPKESTKSKHTRRDSINPTASDTLLPNLETGNGLPAAVSPDDSSVQAFLFGSTGEAGNISSISNQENSNIASQQKNEITNVFDLTTPLTHLENDLILFGRSTVPSSASTSSSNSTLPPSLNALQKAVIKGRDSIAELLVENGADVYIVDDYGNNILHLAAQSGHASLISFGLSHCVNVNAINVAGETPLHVAIEHDYVEVVDMLIRAGADMEFKS